MVMERRALSIHEALKKHISAAAALALAFCATIPAAQQRKAKCTQMTQSRQVEARHQCFLEAQAAVPGLSIGRGEGTSSLNALRAAQGHPPLGRVFPVVASAGAVG